MSNPIQSGKANRPSSSNPAVPQGLRQAVCSAVTDLGLQPGFVGRGKSRPKVAVVFEAVPDGMGGKEILG